MHGPQGRSAPRRADPILLARQKFRGTGCQELHHYSRVCHLDFKTMQTRELGDSSTNASNSSIIDWHEWVRTNAFDLAENRHFLPFLSMQSPEDVERKMA
jgi:hypothetical protein